MSGIRLTDGQPGPATQSALGLVIQATDAEVALGLNTGKYVTPAALKNAGALTLGLGTAAFKNFADAFFNASDLQGRDIATTAPTDGQALVWSLANSRWQPGTIASGGGTVTSIDASGGTTGLSFSGGPVTSSGTLTLAGTLAVANGGTGATDASGARANLSAAVLGANGDITSLTGLTGGISTPDFVQFDTAAAASSAVGKLFWNDNDGAGTLSVGLKGGTVVHNIGEETFYRVKASAAITKGQAVMFTGVVGSSGQITGAPATGLLPNQGNYIIGVAAEGGALNDWVLVSSFGFVRGFDTTGGAETWASGDVLYFNPAVAGGLTKVIPTAPNPRVEVAAVISAHATTGEILVRVTHGSALGQTDSNVQLGTLADNDFLVYNLANARWQNYSASASRTALGLGSAALLTAAAPSGAATLDSSGKLVSSQLPDIAVSDYLGSVASQAAMLALTGQKGDWAIRSDLGTTWIITGSDPTVLASWTQLSYPAAPVTSVFGRTGAVVATNGDYTASNITNVPAGNLAATTVQAAINELDTEKQATSAQLTSLADLATNGLVARTASNTLAARTLTGTAGQITVTNGDGVAGNPTISLPSTITQATTFQPTDAGTNSQQVVAFLYANSSASVVAGYGGSLRLGSKGIDGGAPSVGAEIRSELTGGTGGNQYDSNLILATRAGGSMVTGLTLSPSGAATFASHITAASGTISGGALSVSGTGIVNGTFSAYNTLFVVNGQVGIQNNSPAAGYSLDVRGNGIFAPNGTSAFNALTLTTDLAITEGGTGASTAAAARANLLPAFAGNATKILAVNAGATDAEWVTSPPSTAVATIATTAPGSPVHGQLWWNSETGNLQIYYTDANSSQWVNVFNRL